MYGAPPLQSFIGVSGDQADPSPMSNIHPQNIHLSFSFPFAPQGVPTHTADGEELSKGARKKAEKEYAAQVTAHEKYLASAGKQ